MTDPRSLQLPGTSARADLFTYLKSLSSTDLLRLSSAGRTLTEHVDDYFLNEFVMESTLTITTKSGDKHSDYQHLKPVDRGNSQTATQTIDRHIVFKLDGSTDFYPYEPGRFQPQELLLRLPDGKDFRWSLSDRDDFHRGFARPLGYTDGRFTDFQLCRSEVEVNVFYEATGSSFRLHAATMTLKSVRNWISKGPGELGDNDIW